MDQTCAAQATHSRSDKNSHGLNTGDVHSRSLDSLIVVLNTSKNKADIHIHQASDSEEKKERHPDDEILLNPLVAKTVDAKNAVSATENIECLDDPCRKQRIHEADDGKIYPS